MGSLVAASLSRQGKSVIVIDSSESSFNHLSNDFSGFKIAGDATQVEILKQAKIAQAQLLLVLTGNDSINLSVAQVGMRFFNVPQAIARVSDPGREDLFKKLGVKTICPVNLGVNALLRMIGSDIKDD
jgi:trk system potassium uptake protein TrkA